MQHIYSFGRSFFLLFHKTCIIQNTIQLMTTYISNLRRKHALALSFTTYNTHFLYKKMSISKPQMIDHFYWSTAITCCDNSGTCTA
jgi:hypothetical protein